MINAGLAVHCNIPERHRFHDILATFPNYFNQLSDSFSSTILPIYSMDCEVESPAFDKSALGHKVLETSLAR